MYYEEDDVKSPVTVRAIGGQIDFYGNNSPSNVKQLNQGMNIIRIVPATVDSDGSVNSGVTALRINHGVAGVPSRDNLYVGALTLVDGLSSKIDDTINGDDLLSLINTYATTSEGKNIFYYLNDVDNDVAINFGANDTILTTRTF